MWQRKRGRTCRRGAKRSWMPIMRQPPTSSPWLLAQNVYAFVPQRRPVRLTDSSLDTVIGTPSHRRSPSTPKANAPSTEGEYRSCRAFPNEQRGRPGHRDRLQSARATGLGLPPAYVPRSAYEHDPQLCNLPCCTATRTVRRIPLAPEVRSFRASSVARLHKNDVRYCCRSTGTPFCPSIYPSAT